MRHKTRKDYGGRFIVKSHDSDKFEMTGFNC